MTSIVHFTACPVCDSARIAPALTVADISITGDVFSIWQCANCNLRFTQDAPDESSIGRYYKSENYISHTNSTKGLVNAVYLRMRRVTLLIKQRLLIKYLGKKNGTLLDVGAGTGAFLGQMQKSGWQVRGIEPDANARGIALQNGVKLEAPDVLPTLPKQSFDAITLWHVLEHVHSLHAYMDILKSLLKERGKLFIAVPNFTSVDANAFGVYWAAYDVPRHLYHFSPQAMKTLVARHGMKLECVKPMWFDAYYISLLSSKYKNGKTSWLQALYVGSKSNAAALTENERCSSLVYIFSL